MESTDAYLKRKHAELRLLNGCLRNPLPLAVPVSAADVIRQKFQLTATLKAEHALHDWAATETDWAQSAQAHSGPFKFSYDYQRADLDVKGPSFYALDADLRSETVYTASGMAAISALLLASARVIDGGDILILPGSYGETLELIECHARHLRLVTINRSLEQAIASTTAFRILLLDSCAPGRAFESILRWKGPALDLLIFDTTCFSGYSGRVRRVLNWAGQRNIPVVMVRSHTKLDSLGAEYGRLGSANFVHWRQNSCWAARSKLEALPQETRNAVRLLGGAAVPAHFPPYVGAAAYRELTNKRMAAILHNSRRAGQYFAAVLADLTEELRYTHGLYLTLSGETAFDEAGARRAAADMSEALAHAGLAIRHAGSFGFDFAAAEWFRAATTDRYSVRIAVPDLPTLLWDELTEAIARWWLKHQRKSIA
ncbi:MAG: hypothetical protein JO141_26565 [Bradyrhizobium sp.]|nr:hypothetical protein [Bradyrhizobium sp.]